MTCQCNLGLLLSYITQLYLNSDEKFTFMDVYGTTHHALFALREDVRGRNGVNFPTECADLEKRLLFTE